MTHAFPSSKGSASSVALTDHSPAESCKSLMRTIAQPCPASWKSWYCVSPSDEVSASRPDNGSSRQVLPQRSSSRMMAENGVRGASSRGAMTERDPGTPGTISSSVSPGTSANFELPSGSTNRRKRKSFSTKLCTRVPPPPRRRSPRRIMILSPGLM